MENFDKWWSLSSQQVVRDAVAAKKLPYRDTLNVAALRRPPAPRPGLVPFEVCGDLPCLASRDQILHSDN